MVCRVMVECINERIVEIGTADLIHYTITFEDPLPDDSTHIVSKFAATILRRCNPYLLRADGAFNGRTVG